MAKRYYVALLVTLVICSVTLALFFMGESRALSTARQQSVQYEIQVILKAKSNPPDFWRIVEQGVRVAGEEYNALCEVTGPETEQDIDDQIALVRTAIAKKPDAIILAAGDYARLAPVCEEADKAGIPVLTVDSDVAFEGRKCFVGTDNYELGKKLAQQVDLLIKPEERFGVVGHIATVTTGIERERGLLDNVVNAKERLADIKYCESLESVAQERATKMLQEYPDIKCMVGLNESSAIGVTRAVKSMGLGGKVKVVACDSSQEQIGMMEEGTMQAFVVQNPFNMGYLSVKSAVELLRGQPIPEIISTESVVVTKENLYKKENQKLLFPFSNEE